VGGCREEGRKEMDVLAPKKKRGRDVFFGGVVPPRNIYGLPETLRLLSPSLSLLSSHISQQDSMEL